MSTLGTRIKTARERKKILQSELAEMIDVKSAGVISNWEKDLSKPDANKIVRLCKALNVSASYLLDYFGDDNFEIMPHEIELIKKYRNLDDKGRKLVDDVLERENENVETINDIADYCDMVVNIVEKGEDGFKMPTGQILLEHKHIPRKSNIENLSNMIINIYQKNITTKSDIDDSTIDWAKTIKYINAIKHDDCRSEK